MQRVDEILGHLDEEGYCIIEEVIPPDKVGGIRDSVFATHKTQAEEADANAAKLRGQGHRIGATGVRVVVGFLNFDQSFAPYLADERIVGTAEKLFGPFVRITNVNALLNYPKNDRGYWHADWPFNQTNASHVPAPYADAVLRLSSIWMLTDFSPHTGGTLVIPGSHRTRTNPSGGDVHDREAPHPAEMQISGAAGSVMLFDSRLWHCVTTNESAEPRIAMNVGYAPWWLNLLPNLEGSPDFQRMVVETNGKPTEFPPVERSVYDNLPETVKPLLRHSVHN